MYQSVQRKFYHMFTTFNQDQAFHEINEPMLQFYYNSDEDLL